MRFITFTLLLLMTLSINAVDNLIVRQSMGDKSISIASISHITFPTDGSGVVVNFTDGTSETFARGTFVSLRFNGSLSGIDKIASENQSGLIFSTDCSTISVADENVMIEVYPTAGALVAEGKGALNISNLVSGTYIVKAGTIITKIVKR